MVKCPYCEVMGVVKLVESKIREIKETQKTLHCDGCLETWEDIRTIRSQWIPKIPFRKIKKDAPIKWPQPGVVT